MIEPVTKADENVSQEQDQYAQESSSNIVHEEQAADENIGIALDIAVLVQRRSASQSSVYQLLSRIVIRFIVFQIIR